jgi:hypothetical protein
MFQPPIALSSIIAVPLPCYLFHRRIHFAPHHSQTVFNATQAPGLPALNANKAFCSLQLQETHAYVTPLPSLILLECKVDNCWKCAEPASSSATQSTQCAVCQAGYLLNPTDGSCFKYRCDLVT